MSIVRDKIVAWVICISYRNCKQYLAIHTFEREVRVETVVGVTVAVSHPLP